MFLQETGDQLPSAGSDPCLEELKALAESDKLELFQIPDEAISGKQKYHTEIDAVLKNKCTNYWVWHVCTLATLRVYQGHGLSRGPRRTMEWQSALCQFPSSNSLAIEIHTDHFFSTWFSVLLRKYAKNFYIRRADPKAVDRVNKIAKTKLQADLSPLNKVANIAVNTP